jgi:DNA-binding CsgD family transcriptional regulator
VVSLTAVGLSVIVARARTVWGCVLLLDVAYAALVLPGHTPVALQHHGQLGGVIGALVSYPFVALILLTLRRLFQSFDAGAAPGVESLRRDPSGLTPALAQALAGRRLVAALPAGPSALDGLTPAEMRTVRALAAGIAPKELAHQLGGSISTIRAHIRNAKRKTGARTLRELVAVVAQEHTGVRR